MMVVVVGGGGSEHTVVGFVCRRVAGVGSGAGFMIHLLGSVTRSIPSQLQYPKKEVSKQEVQKLLR